MLLWDTPVSNLGSPAVLRSHTHLHCNRGLESVNFGYFLHFSHLLEEWNVKQVIAEGEKRCLGCTVWKVVQHISLERFLQMGLRGLTFPWVSLFSIKFWRGFFTRVSDDLIFPSISSFQDNIILERFFTWLWEAQASLKFLCKCCFEKPRSATWARVHSYFVIQICIATGG